MSRACHGRQAAVIGRCTGRVAGVIDQRILRTGGQEPERDDRRDGHDAGADTEPIRKSADERVARSDRELVAVRAEPRCGLERRAERGPGVAERCPGDAEATATSSMPAA